MKTRRMDLALCAAVFVSLCVVSWLKAQTPPKPEPPKEGVATAHATGPFEVKMTPQDDKPGDGTTGRFTVDKQYHGDLEGTGKAQMLTAGSVAKGNAAYVAIERVTGTLKGRAGSFTLQHSGTISNGVQNLVITIVPDSGTEQLAGISGRMRVNIAAGGKHSYDLEYTAPKRE
jgi:hypothetical protein